MKKNTRVSPTPSATSSAESKNVLDEADSNIDNYSILIACNKLRAELDSIIADLYALKDKLLNDLKEFS